MTLPSPSLLSLPLDIKFEIIHHITEPNDLESLSLLCKEFRETVAPKLFRRLVLDLNGGEPRNTSFVTDALTQPNIHLARELFVHVRGNADGALEKVVELLPPNLLQKFALNRTGSMPLKTFLRLCEKQANLRIVTIPILSDFSYDFIEAIANEETCKNLEIVKIRGVINSWQNTCTLAQELIRRAHSSLRQLHIMPFQHWKDASNVTIIPNTNLGPVPKTLFKHMLQSSLYEPLALTHLTFDNIPLETSTTFMTKFICFSSLSELRLRRCPNSGLFLEALMQSDPLITIRLKRFEYAEYTNSNMDTLNAFLKTFKGLEQLYLIFQTSSELPDIASIIHHADTLSLLMVETSATIIDNDDEYSQCYKPTDFRDILRACSKLQQLSIELPPQYIVEEDVSSYNIKREWPLYMTTLLALPNLQVLNLKIFTNHRNFRGDNDYPWWGLADEIADQICHEAIIRGNSTLLVLGIGSCSNEIFPTSYDHGGVEKRRWYVPCQIKNRLGRIRSGADSVCARDLQGAVETDIVAYQSPWWRLSNNLSRRQLIS